MDKMPSGLESHLRSSKQSLGYLYKELETVRDALVFATDMVLVHRLQGRAQVLLDMIEQIDGKKGGG